MNRAANAPIVISGIFAAAQILWSVRIVVDPETFAVGSSILITGGIIIYTVIAVAGILLVRAPWARWLALATAIATLLIGSAAHAPNAFSLAAGIMSLIAIGGLSGPWLRIWLRRRPGAGTGTAALILPLVAIGALPLAGLVFPEGPVPATGVAAAAMPVLAWAYARALPWGLWGLRLAALPLALGSAFVAGGWASWPLIAHSAAVTAIAWSPGARDAASPSGATLPESRARSGRGTPR